VLGIVPVALAIYLVTRPARAAAAIGDRDLTRRS